MRIVTVLGAGVIGSSWATNFAFRECEVRLYDVAEEALENAKNAVVRNLNVFVKYDIIKAEDIEPITARISYTTDMKTALEGTYLVQECGPDNYPVKQAILAEVDKYAPDALFLSSTTALSISEIAKDSAHPERCMGGHPFNPPHLIPLVEISKGQKTSQESVDKAVAFYESINKVPVVCKKEKLGFIANRMQWALYREAIDLVITGTCSIEDVDKAVTYGPGMRWAILGPNMLFELGGGKDGIRGMNKLSGSTAKGYADLATWGAKPADWFDNAQPGVDEAKKNLPDFIGHTNEEIAAFRDSMLIELLKLHRKL